MPAFLARRLGFGLFQLVVVVVAVFVLLRALPADPALHLVGTEATHAELETARHQIGVDRPVTSQLATFAGDLVHGDLGTSWLSPAPISHQIAVALPVSLQLVVLSILLALVVVVPLGLFAAQKPDRRLSKIVRGYSLAAGSIPDFWLGLMLIYVGYYLLKIFPSPLGLQDSFAFPPAPHTNFILVDALIDGQPAVFVDVLHHLALPVITFALALSGPFLKMVRESAISTTQSEFMLYARAIALPRSAQRRILLRNSLTPLFTLVGVYFGALLGGSVIIETIYSLNGMGVYTLRSVQQLDFPAVQSSVLVLTALSLAVYLLMDVLYRVIDPRVELGGGRR
jgi:ABC-type dipeptide/oligopeptide/nickel transport system permease component